MTGLLVPTVFAVALFWWQDVRYARNATLTASSPAPGRLLHVKPLASSASFLEYGLHRRAVELAGIFLGAAGMLAVGLLDDKRELRPATKFAGQLLVAALVAVCGVRITLFVHSEVFHYAITMLWILTVINAFNFMDNMNGLCAGLGAIGSWCFATVAAAGGQYLVALIAFLTFGALLGFLPYNFPKARAFLGDAGSHLVGYLLAVLAILPHFYTPRHPYHSAVLIPLFALALPLLDLARVVIVRWRIGQPFYQGDTNHLSHLLVRIGLTKTRAVLLIWMVAAGFSALANLF
jgi:UDP-GlcNAc:undecaprenyl-phosphate GlcNAc-1-phosphate transferase